MNATRHRITAVRSGAHPTIGDWDQDYEITFTYLPGAAPIIHPADNADPGYPAEIEFVSIEPDADDHGVFSDIAQRWLIEWAKEWLDEHYYECIDHAEADRQPDPDAARDARIDDELCGAPRYDDGDW